MQSIAEHGPAILNLRVRALWRGLGRGLSREDSQDRADTDDTKSSVGNISPIHIASSLRFTAMVLREARRLQMRTEMNTEMRELTDNELDAVNGGFLPLVVGGLAVVGAAIGMGVIARRRRRSHLPR